jgi:hypothetical protein
MFTVILAVAVYLPLVLVLLAVAFEIKENLKEGGF